MKSFLRAALVAFIAASTLASAQSSSPDAMVKSTVDEVLAVMRQNQDP